MVRHLKDQGENVSAVLPGEIFLNNFQFTIQTQQGSNFAWKKAIKQTYPDVIVGSQKSSHNINMKVSFYFPPMPAKKWLIKKWLIKFQKKL